MKKDTILIDEHPIDKADQMSQHRPPPLLLSSFISTEMALMLLLQVYITLLDILPLKFRGISLVGISIGNLPLETSVFTV